MTSKYEQAMIVEYVIAGHIKILFSCLQIEADTR